MQVFDKDEKKIYTTLLAIPNERLEPSDKPVVLFSERAAGSPQAVKVWFYPGERIGNEFVYPKTQAMKIAKETHQSVLAMDDTSSARRVRDRRSSAASTRTATGRSNEQRVSDDRRDHGARYDARPPRRVNDRECGATARRRPGTAGDGADTTRRHGGRTRQHLPRTASSLALFELLSGLSLAGGLAVACEFAGH